MIQANELRIGNWVYDNVLNGYVQFKSFFGLCNAETKPEQYSPIPLTSDILDKCGFVKEYDVYSKSAFEIANVTDGNGNKSFVLLNGKNPASVCFYHLHQLQNLYFALTGEELTIKL